MVMIDSVEILKVQVSIHIPWLLEFYKVKALKLGKNQVTALMQRLERSVCPKKKQNLDS